MKTNDAAPKKRSWRLWFYAAVLLVFGLPPALFFIVSTTVNHTRIPAELQQLPPDLAPRFTSTTPPPRTTSTLFAFPIAHRTRGDHAPTETQTNYDTFLETELRERPSLDGARLYLALSNRFHSNDESRILYDFDIDEQHGFRPWQPGKSLPTQDIQWLRAHADIVEQFLQFAESEGLPIRSRAAIMNDPEPISLGGPSYNLVSRGADILAAEGQHCLESGDVARAVRVWCAAIRMTVNAGGEPGMGSNILGILILNVTTLPLESWVTAGGASRETLVALQSLMAQVHTELFPSDWLIDLVNLKFPVARENIIAQLKIPWNDPMFGWDINASDRYDYYYSSVSLGKLDLPRVDRMAGSAIRAMQNKREAAKWLREYDDSARELNRRIQMTWPELIKSAPFNQISKNNPLRQTAYPIEQYAISPDIILRDIFPRALKSETRLNLLRAAIAWRLAPPQAKPNLQMLPIQDRESPWRDPFTEKAFQSAAPAATTSATLRLYSLGPDLADQRGQIQYDPTNGTISAGDLALDLK